MSLADALPVTLELNPSHGGVTMPKASLFAGTVLLSAVTAILATGSRADDKRTLTVTAVTHDSRVKEQTSYHTRPGQSTTDCTGTGSDPGDTGTLRINMDCNTTATPPTTSSITTRSTDVTEKVIDADNNIYTIVCTDRPNILAAAIAGAAAGGGASGGNTTLSGRGKCIPLKDGDQFDAEIKDTTMWVLARKGGNQGKGIKIKYKILDIRQGPAASAAQSSNATPLEQCRGDERDVKYVWMMGRRLGEKDSEIADAIKQHGVCKVMAYLWNEDMVRASNGQCRGGTQDIEETGRLVRSLGKDNNEITRLTQKQGDCVTLVELRSEAERKERDEKAQLSLPPPPEVDLAPAALPPESSLFPSTQPPPPPSPSLPEKRTVLPRGTYQGTAGGHQIREISKNGAIITLEDGSLWEIGVGDRRRAAIWRPATNITVLRSESRVDEYKYTLINKDDGEKALAKYLGKE